MSRSDAQLSDSKNGFQTKVWGSPLWLFLHIISLNYTPDKKAGYKRFFKALQFVLPCGACRTNYKKILKEKLPLEDYVFSCRESMAMWVFLLHNHVQKDIFTKSKIQSDAPAFKDTKKDFFTAMQFYESFRAQCHKKAYGCVTPVKGSKKRTKIQIVKYNPARKNTVILNKSST